MLIKENSDSDSPDHALRLVATGVTMMAQRQRKEFMRSVISEYLVSGVIEVVVGYVTPLLEWLRAFSDDSLSLLSKLVLPQPCHPQCVWVDGDNEPHIAVKYVQPPN